MEELYAEGVATHGGPESCVDVPRGRGEALTGVRAGRAIEPRNEASGCPRCTRGGRQHRWRRFREPSVDPAGSESHGMYGTSMRENREIPRSPMRLITGGPLREHQVVRLRCTSVGSRTLRSTCEPAEQGRRPRRWGRKGSEPRGTRPAKRLPDAVPGQGRPVRWSVCVRLHDETRMRGSRRCCTMSTWSGSGRLTGRSARRPPRGWTR